MDVVLDSNIYLSDIRMESIKFKNLFDYLRRTKSTLVLPRLVREETVGKYRHKLDNQSKKATSAVQELNKFIVDKKNEIHFHAPDLKYAVRDLRAKFRAPAKGISVRFYPETNGVGVSEVFLRGVNRRRPANSEGEELRDVIIWLIVLQYAEAEKKPVALVTADGGFWNDTQVHDHILEDIKSRNVDVRVFRTLEDFVKASAPAPVKVDAAYVSKIFDETKLMPDLLAAVKKTLENSKRIFLQPFTVRSVQPATSKLSEGTAFEINPETKFLELTYDLTFIARVELREWNFQQPRTGGLLSQMLAMPAMPAVGWAYGTTVPTGLVSGWWDSPQLPNPFAKPESPQAERITLKDYAVYAKAQISVRLVNEALTEAELDGLEINKVEETAKAERAEPEPELDEPNEAEPDEAADKGTAPSADSPDKPSDSPSTK